MKSSDPVADHVSNAINIPIKVVKLSNKRDSKTYMLNLQLEQLTTLKCLREQILEQLGKSVVSFDLQFDVGYLSGTHKICFAVSDNIGAKLKRLHEKGKSLWCDGFLAKPNMSSVVCLDSDSEEDLHLRKLNTRKKRQMP